MNKKLQADLNSSKDVILSEHGKLQNEIMKLKELCSDYERKQKDSQRTIDSLQIQLKKMKITNLDMNRKLKKLERKLLC